MKRSDIAKLYAMEQARQRQQSRGALRRIAGESVVRESVVREARKESEQPKQFEKFSASELYCPKCKEAMPVKEKLLLVLADGELYDYRCQRCGTSVGQRKVG